jgi:Domain of unknown function (DUF4395)
MSAASPEPMLGLGSLARPESSRLDLSGAIVHSSKIQVLLHLTEMQKLFAFPNPVNEKAARTVASAVLATVIVILATGAYWLLIPLAYGFWARVLTGPTLSPLGWTAQKLIAPRLGPSRPVPGPPKRFAQGMGAVMATGALVLALIVGDHTAADVVLGLFVVAAGLEAIVGFCIGCRLFGLLMRAGLVPDGVCEQCADISSRLAAASR